MIRRYLDEGVVGSGMGLFRIGGQMSIFFPNCKDKKPKFRNKYSQKRNIGFSVPISFMRLSVIYIFPRPVCLFSWRKYVDRSWDYINRSQTHECGNLGWGRAIPRKGIHKVVVVSVLYSYDWYSRTSNALKNKEIFCNDIGPVLYNAPLHIPVFVEVQKSHKHICITGCVILNLFYTKCDWITFLNFLSWI
jgi:hypothetical protein